MLVAALTPEFRAKHAPCSKGKHCISSQFAKKMQDRNEGLINKFTVLLGNVNSISNDQSENEVGEGLEDMHRDIDRSNWHIKVLLNHHKIHIL